MNTIKIFLATDGSQAVLQKDFSLYQGEYQNKLVNVYIPTSVLAPQFTSWYIAQDGTVTVDTLNARTAVKIGALYVSRSGKVAQTRAFYLRPVKVLTVNGVEYQLFERLLPSAFTVNFTTALKVVVNAVNIVDVQNIIAPSGTTYYSDTACTVSVGTLPSSTPVLVDASENYTVRIVASGTLTTYYVKPSDCDVTIGEKTASVITSQECSLEVNKSDYLDDDIDTDVDDPSELESLEARVNQNSYDISLLEVYYTGLSADLMAETAARIAADTTLQNNIDSEQAAREAADSELQDNIDTEATTRAAVDTTLQNNINAEAATRAAADTTLQNNIDAETTARENADSILETDIGDLQEVTPQTQGTAGQFLQSNGTGNRPTWANLGNIYVYKGSVATYADLPTTGNEVGDVWNVVAAYDTYPAGTNFAWNGTEWDALGGSIDTTGFIKADGSVLMDADYTPTADSQEVATAKYVDESVAVETAAREAADDNIELNARQYNTPIIGGAYAPNYVNIYANVDYISAWLKTLTYTSGLCVLKAGTSQGSGFGTPKIGAYNNATDANNNISTIIYVTDGGDSSDPGEAIILWSEYAGTFSFGDWTDVSTAYAGWNYGQVTLGGVSTSIVDSTTGEIITLSGGGANISTAVNALIDGIISSTQFKNGIKFATKYAEFETDNSIGKQIKLSFNGTVSGTVVTFELDSTIADFQMKNLTQYLLHLTLPVVGTLTDSWTVIFKDSNNNTVNLNCVTQKDTAQTCTIGDLIEQQTYNTESGFEWDFQVVYYEYTENNTAVRVFYTYDIDLQSPQVIKFSNLAIAQTDWEVTADYGDYMYMCAIPCTGVLATDVANVTFGLTDAISGNFAPINTTANGTVTIYSKVEAALTIPTITIFREV